MTSEHPPSPRARLSTNGPSLSGAVVPSGSPRLSDFHMHRTQVAGIGQGSRKSSRDGATQKREYKEKRKNKEKKGKKAKADKAAASEATHSLRGLGKESMDELASSVGMRRATMASAHKDPEELFSVRLEPGSSALSSCTFFL